MFVMANVLRHSFSMLDLRYDFVRLSVENDLSFEQ